MLCYMVVVLRIVYKIRESRLDKRYHAIAASNNVKVRSGIILGWTTGQQKPGQNNGLNKNTQQSKC